MRQRFLAAVTVVLAAGVWTGCASDNHRETISPPPAREKSPLPENLKPNPHVEMPERTSQEVRVPENDPRRGRAERLFRAGNAAMENDRKVTGRRCLAEAWAITALIYWDKGNPASAREAWYKAQNNGWTGRAPWYMLDRPQ